MQLCSWLRYRATSRKSRVDSRWCHWNFSLIQSFRAPLTEMSTRNISWDQRRPVHRADNIIAFTLIINQQMHLHKIHIKIFKIAPTCFDPKIILRELRCSLLQSL